MFASPEWIPYWTHAQDDMKIASNSFNKEVEHVLWCIKDTFLTSLLRKSCADLKKKNKITVRNPFKRSLNSQNNKTMNLVYSSEQKRTPNASFKIIILFQHEKIGRFYLRRN